MSERVPSVTEKGQLIEDAVSLFLSGLIYEGWEDVQLTRQLNAAASDFQLQITDKWRAEMDKWGINPGDPVHIHIGKKSTLTGYTDKVTTTLAASSRTITVSGRSKTGDLVDCSVEGSAQYSGLSLKEIAEKVCAPFGVKVSFLSDAGGVFPTITLQQGETVFSLLDRLAKERKLLMYPSYEGNLIFTTVGKGSAAVGLTEGINILSARANNDFSNRFSKYVVKGQDLGKAGEAFQAVSVLGTSTDAGITRYRPLVLMAENNVEGSTSENRADYECNLRAAKAQTAEVEVQGWFQAPGRLWEINERVYVDCGSIGLRRTMLVDKVTFNKNGSGTKTTLSLIREDAYSFKKGVKKEDPLSWTKALKTPTNPNTGATTK